MKTRTLWITAPGVRAVSEEADEVRAVLEALGLRITEADETQDGNASFEVAVETDEEPPDLEEDTVHCQNCAAPIESLHGISKLCAACDAQEGSS